MPEKGFEPSKGLGPTSNVILVPICYLLPRPSLLQGIPPVAPASQASIPSRTDIGPSREARPLAE